jgi:putative sterol carrier protein
MAYFESIEQMYEVYEKFLKMVVSDPVVGAKLAKSKVKIRFNYTDPDGSILLNFADPPKEEGAFGSFVLGDIDDIADVTMAQTADFSHRFWQGKENAITALAMGRIKASGAVQKAMGLVTAIRPTYKMYKSVLKDMGLEDMIID